MRKLAKKIIPFLLVMCIGFAVFAAPAFALTEDDLIIFKKFGAEGELVIMPVAVNTNGIASATLTDANNVVLTTFKTLTVKSGTTISYKKNFTTLKSGTYYLNVALEYSPSFQTNKTMIKTLKITHVQPVTKLAYIETYQGYTDSGDVKQVFKFDYSNAQAKQINIEIYDEYGAIVNKSKFVAKYVNGTYTYNWDYYPSSGLMVSSGIYIVKYWIEGQTPKQTKFQVSLGEG